MKRNDLSDREERVALVKAMEYIARQVNDEEVFNLWLAEGVADADIGYGDFQYRDCDDNIADWYAESRNFSDLMDVFLRLMSAAKKSGGLYCGGITSSLG